MALPWCDKHAPKDTSEIIGQGAGKVIEYINRGVFKKACLIVGPSGVGKSATAHAIACELGMQLVEFSVDDKRNAQYIKEQIDNTVVTKGFFGQKLVLIDDVDLLDRGGVPELIKCIKKSLVPIIMTAADEWDPKLRSLKTHCEIIKYKRMSASWIKKILDRTAKSEGVKVSDDILYKIASNALGDARAGINDLELLGKDKEITEFEVEALTYREKPLSIFDGLNRLYNSSTFDDSINSLNDVNLDFNEKILWISENTSFIKSLKELSYTYNNLSRADLFIGRIRRWQYWRYLVYAEALMTAGLSNEKKQGYYNFKSPSKIMKLYRTKVERELTNRVVASLQSRIKSSKSKIKSEHMPYLRLIAKNKNLKEEMLRKFNLSPDESKVFS